MKSLGDQSTSADMGGLAQDKRGLKPKDTKSVTKPLTLEEALAPLYIKASAPTGDIKTHELRNNTIRTIQALVASIVPDPLKMRVPYDLVELQKAYENGFNKALDLIVGNATEVGLLGASDSHSETAKPVNKQVDKPSEVSE